VGTPAPHQCSAIDPFTDLLGSLGLSVKVAHKKVCHFRDLGWVSVPPLWAFHVVLHQNPVYLWMMDKIRQASMNSTKRSTMMIKPTYWQLCMSF
jgi:hypothetical protein